MANIIIWDKETDLKGISKDIWLEGYPQAMSKTLALIDDKEVVFIEDLKEAGYTGNTDMNIIENYINSKKNDVDLEIKKANERISTLSTALEELTLTVVGG